MKESAVIDMRTAKAERNSNGEADDLRSNSSNKKKTKTPKYSKFSQQELPACKPLLTPGLVIASFTFVGLVFIPIGLASLFASRNVVEIVQRYDIECIPGHFSSNMVDFIRNSKTDKTCKFNVTVPKHMKSPIFVYYQLDNFYQNHRRYVRSRSDKQLQSPKEESNVESCKPEQFSSDGKPIVPCGLVAWSLFNDTYKFSLKKKDIQVNKKNIAWKSDKEGKFGSDVYPKNFQKGGLIGGGQLNSSVPLSEQEDLMVWMRTAALPTFRKLYGKIEEDLQEHDIIDVEVQNNYNSYGYGGKKNLILSTSSWIGGKNDFLGFAYLIIGGFCFSMAVTFIFIYVFKPRPLGDPAFLSWNKNPAELKR
ncbi:ALA-interacting subunit 3 [Turnera subulata]|uniref:ALA-interacting subunit n=1 Tax=Turnera subulata TaxID=218843 RepID=A0A9Q0G5T3_9ROSI|nr:ALA-interacting subunit 3 [Turnera subulata]